MSSIHDVWDVFSGILDSDVVWCSWISPSCRKRGGERVVVCLSFGNVSSDRV